MKYALLVPAVLLFALFVAWPLGEVVRLSMTETNYITSEFVGVQNYVRAFTDRAFMRSVLNSALYILMIVPAQVGTALLVALAVVDLPKRWHDAARITFYIPLMAAGIIIAQVWRWVFHINGPLNWLLGTQIAWFAHWYTGLPAISIICITSTLGGQVIVFSAAMLAIDKSLLDAARIDGARPWQIKFRIITPIIWPSIATMSLIGLIATPQVFETIYALAPYEHTATMAFRIYQDGFMTSQYGRAAAEAILLLVFVMALSLVKRRIERGTA